MHSTVCSCPSSATTSFIHHSPSLHTSLLSFPTFPTPSHQTRRRRISVTYSAKSCRKHLTHLHFPFNATPIQLFPCLEGPFSSSSIKTEESHLFSVDGKNVLKWFAKPIAFTLFWIVVGFSGVRGFQFPANAAATVAVERTVSTKVKEKDENLARQGHEYSDCTRRLLETVSGLLRAIEDVKSGCGELKNVEAGLKVVKMKKKELQEEIMSGLYNELRVLREKKEDLIKHAEKIVDAVTKAKREQQSMVSKEEGDEGLKERFVKLQEDMNRCEEEYNEIWERIGEIEDQILRRETSALSIGVREITFIERECELLAKKFTRERQRRMGR